MLVHKLQHKLYHLKQMKNILFNIKKFLIKYVTEFAKKGLIHASDFSTLTRHNFICKQAIKLKFSVLLVQ